MNPEINSIWKWRHFLVETPDQPVNRFRITRNDGRQVDYVRVNETVPTTRSVGDFLENFVPLDPDPGSGAAAAALVLLVLGVGFLMIGK